MTPKVFISTTWSKYLSENAKSSFSLRDRFKKTPNELSEKRDASREAGIVAFSHTYVKRKKNLLAFYIAKQASNEFQFHMWLKLKNKQDLCLCTLSGHNVSHGLFHKILFSVYLSTVDLVS